MIVYGETNESTCHKHVRFIEISAGVNKKGLETSTRLARRIVSHSSHFCVDLCFLFRLWNFLCQRCSAVHRGLAFAFRGMESQHTDNRNNLYSTFALNTTIKLTSFVCEPCLQVIQQKLEPQHHLHNPTHPYLCKKCANCFEKSHVLIRHVKTITSFCSPKFLTMVLLRKLCGFINQAHSQSKYLANKSSFPRTMKLLVTILLQVLTCRIMNNYNL